MYLDYYNYFIHKLTDKKIQSSLINFLNQDIYTTTFQNITTLFEKYNDERVYVARPNKKKIVLLYETNLIKNNIIFIFEVIHNKLKLIDCVINDYHFNYSIANYDKAKIVNNKKIQNSEDFNQINSFIMKKILLNSGLYLFNLPYCYKTFKDWILFWNNILICYSKIKIESLFPFNKNSFKYIFIYLNIKYHNIAFI